MKASISIQRPTVWNTWGGTTKEYDVDVDPRKLEAYGVTLQQVITALGNANVNAAVVLPGQISPELINEGDLPDFLHIVIDGSVEMYGTDNGRETTIDILQPVTTFILAAVIRDERYLKSARTLSPGFTMGVNSYVRVSESGFL